MLIGAAFTSPNRLLLEHLIDYAGLFPPAELRLVDALDEYRLGRRGSAGWVLGRFLCPASQLEPLAGALTASMVAGEEPWSIGVVVDEPVATATARAHAFEQTMTPAATVGSIEVRLPSADDRPDPAEIEALAVATATASPAIETYLEIPIGAHWEHAIDAAVETIAALNERGHPRLGAKLRCGGNDAAAFPSVEQVVHFVGACAAAGVRYKATAGLHAPLRHFDPNLGAHRHGFLNLLVASALATRAAPRDTIVAALSDEEVEHFAVTVAGLSWEGEMLATSTIKQMRTEGFVAFGSCSFRQPIDHLNELGMLED